MGWNTILKIGWLTLVCCLMGGAPFSYAQEAARLYSTEGLVEGLVAPATTWQSVTPSTIFQNGDAVRTGDGSRAALVGKDGMMVRLSSNALLEFKPQKDGSQGELAIGSGDAYFLSRDPHTFPKVTTSIVSGSIRGTEFTVSVRPRQVTFSVLNGSVEVANSFGTVALADGEEAVTEPGKAPQRRLMVKPFDAVQWALRYPSQLSIAGFTPWLEAGSDEERKAAGHLRKGEYLEAKRLFAQNTARSILGRALTELVLNGRSSAAEELKAAQSLSDPGIAVLQSALALEAGQLDAAKAWREKAAAALRDTSGEGTVALQRLLKSQEAAILIVQNQREEADKVVAGLLAESPNNVDALYANSLLQQSKGNVSGAIENVEQALQQEPDNAALLARSAELSFGSGDLQKAERLVESALQRDPRDSDAQVVRGFILLAQDKVKEGLETFERIVAADPSNAQAHLGLGIAKFRSGDREQGRVELQKAVHLEPQVSLYRSYLGKAFFENEQEDLAAAELGTAAKLDPLDPTPHLYAAFNHLATFRPVEALGSLEEAIARNDNRAVYRSRLLLDKDQATRGTGLGRIFSALDFIQPARVEALKSLAEDPTNYEAHFLLKDSLIGPETDSAAIAEDVVGTLLAPATFSGLLPTASGSATLNEYTTLFERPQSRNVIDVIGQSKDQLFESSVVHFAGGDDYSYLLRHGMAYADGYRDNDYDRFQTARLLGQYQLTPEDKLLLEGIVADRELGDTSIGIDPDSNDPDQSFDFEDFSSRLGYHHVFSESSHLIAQTLYVNSRSVEDDLSQERQFGVDLEREGEPLQELTDGGVFDVHSRIRTKGVRGDLQHLWDSEYLSLVSGASVVDFEDSQDGESSTEQDDLEFFGPVSFSSSADNDVHAYRGYSYATIKPVRSFRLVAGLNYSDIAHSKRQSEPFVVPESNENDLSPKAGIIFYPTSSTTLRAAHFETLGASSSRELEGIEPGQVAGIQQIFDDPVGTHARITGVGADWKLPKETYLGVNAITRSLNTPVNFASELITVRPDDSLEGFTPEENFEAHSQEHTIGGYLNQILTDSLVGSLNHDWTETDNDFDSFQLRTHRTRLGLNYFDTSGMFLFSSATWRSQDREGFDAPDSSASSDFLILSAGVGWQFPHRHGSIQLAVRNLLDEDFNYQPIASDVRFYPGIDVSLGVSFNF